MASRKTKTKKPLVQKPTILRTFALSQEDEETLTQLAQEVADTVGRAPSRSAIFRALLRLARDSDPALLNRLVGFIEIELSAGVRWGKDSTKK
jgi:hypothetical protein